MTNKAHLIMEYAKVHTNASHQRVADAVGADRDYVRKVRAKMKPAEGERSFTHRRHVDEAYYRAVVENNEHPQIVTLIAPPFKERKCPEPEWHSPINTYLARRRYFNADGAPHQGNGSGW